MSKENCFKKNCEKRFVSETITIFKQAGAKQGQAQLELGLDFTLIFYRLGFSRFGFVELDLEVDFVLYVWLKRFGLVYPVLYISNILPSKFNIVDLVL